MQAPSPAPPDGPSFHAEFMAGDDPRRPAIETQMDALGVPLALPSRAEWQAVLGGGTPGHFAAAFHGDGRPAFATGVQVGRSRAALGHQIWRVDRAGLDVPTGAVRAAFAAVRDAAARLPRVLRVEVTSVAVDAGRRAALTAVQGELGFRRVASDRIYANTIALDLQRGDAEALLAALPKNTRRNIRLPGQRGLAIRPIDDPALAPRMTALLHETLARTGGAVGVPDWAGIIELSRRRPDRSRLVGMFVQDGERAGELLALAWGCHHGEYAQYDTGASTRDSPVSAPLSYALIWDLVVWARAHGARWFDFGGVTAGTGGSADALGGISDFKRQFSPTAVPAGEEWTFEPHPGRARVARAVGGLVRRLRAARHHAPASAPAAPPRVDGERTAEAAEDATR